MVAQKVSKLQATNQLLPSHGIEYTDANMLAARDQENLVHAHQTTAAAKAWNQGTRGLQPKTPGNKAPKTPFRVAFNDENRPLRPNGQPSGGKGLGKGDENAFHTAKKELESKQFSFVTPAAPRSRAPLGIKTTNARGNAFQTPAPPQTLNPAKTNRQSAARRSLRSKIHVAPSEPVQADILSHPDDEVPAVEFAPPTPVPLPDLPEDFEYDQSFPQFQGRNLTRGWAEIYGSPTDEDGVSLRFRRLEESYAERDRNLDVEITRQVEESFKNQVDLDAELDRRVEAMIAAGPKTKTNPKNANVDTLRARDAAAVLSQPRVPAAAMKPTASSLQKSKKKPAVSGIGSTAERQPTNPSPMRHTAAAAVSKNTIGFPRAKKAPSIIPAPSAPHARQCTRVDPARSDPLQFVELYGPPPEGSDMWLRLKLKEIAERRCEPDDADALAEEELVVAHTDFFSPRDAGLDDDDDDDDDSDDEVFQLKIPD